MHEVNFDKEKGDRDMKKRKMILSVMLLLSITTGCAAGEAKALSDSKGRMSLSQQIAKCNSKESAISIAENGIEKIFGANKYALAGDASYNQDSSVQPDGWFVQLYDEDWDYAVWITEDKNRIHFVRGGEAHPLEFISEQEMRKSSRVRKYWILPRHWLRSSWGMTGKSEMRILIIRRKAYRIIPWM